ncbi:hypothetical protein LTR85_004831 [Meristemomyces frigidus]|nr:hypothetical protein LTR85_004831 [Meristemomyces frigidus]
MAAYSNSNSKTEAKYEMDDRTGSPDEKLEHFVPGYGHERNERVVADVEGQENPNVYQSMNLSLFLSLTAMSFLWIGSQIPLYLFGSVLPAIYTDIGGAGRYQWMVIAYLIPNAALCPFVGNLSDMFGRRVVAAIGQVLLIIGPIVVATATTMNTAIGGQVISGLGAGLNELIALAGTAELVPSQKRGTYVGAVVFTILPFCPSVLWAQLILKANSWRYVGLLVALWNFIGLVLCVVCYKDPARIVPMRPKKEILKEIDYVGGLLSTAGVTCFMMGMQWGASQYTWGSVHVLVPFILGIVLIIAFFVWECFFAKFPMAPPALFRKAPRTMVCVLIMTFFSGGNFFVLLLFWPTQVYNVYGDDPVGIGIRCLPIGFGIILGAALTLVLFPVIKGRTTPLMILACALMTAGTGAMSISNPNNLSTMYGIVTIASLGVGAVIIPCSIIAQLATPDPLIGTITAITLSIRYVGGAIGFTAYYNIFYHKLTGYASTTVAITLVEKGVVPDANIPFITELVTLALQAQFSKVHALIATSPHIPDAMRSSAYGILTGATQDAFSLAYRYPYWMSIAFGGVSLIAACFLKDWCPPASTDMTDNKLDQIVKGAPPPNVSPTQVAQSAKASPSSHSITAPHLPGSSSSSDPLYNLPSSPPQIYLNLLILESSLRLQYLSLRARLRLHLLLLAVLSAWIALFTYLLFFRPREDGSGVGGSVYWVVESAEKLGWCGGVVTLCLFWGTGMYERGVRWPRKFVGTSNRGLRGFNMKVVVVKGSFFAELGGWLGMLDPAGLFREQRVNFQIVPKDIEAGASAKEHWNTHAGRHGLIEEDIAPSGDVLKLLLLPKPFSPDFREGWESYRMDYWDKENARRTDLRKIVKARHREVARREGGWLWWTGWRGWQNVRIFSSKSRRQLDLQKLALKEKPSAERLKEKQRRREGLLRSESHSRSSSRSSTPTPEADGRHPRRAGEERVRRGSSSAGTARRPKKQTAAQGSRLSATETLLQGGDTPTALTKRASNISSYSSTGSEDVKKEETPMPLYASEIKQEPDEA